jgi:hypothetical protein
MPPHHPRGIGRFQGVVSRLQYSVCRIERIYLVHILHALYGSASSSAPTRSRAVRNRVETAVAVALTSLVDETLSTLRRVRRVCVSLLHPWYCSVCAPLPPGGPTWMPCALCGSGGPS